MRSSESGLSLERIIFIASLINVELGDFLPKPRDTVLQTVQVERILDVLYIDLYFIKKITTYLDKEFVAFKIAKPGDPTPIAAAR